MYMFFSFCGILFETLFVLYGNILTVHCLSLFCDNEIDIDDFAVRLFYDAVSVPPSSMITLKFYLYFSSVLIFGWG